MTARKPSSKRKSNRLLPWAGSNTENAALVGELLAGCSWVGIPFAGGMSEVPFLEARMIVANDLHRHVINLCQVVASDAGRAWLIEECNNVPFHPDVMATAQERASEWDWEENPGKNGEAALWYFLACWMNRGGRAGTNQELTGNLAMRWNANGGGSNQRFRTAVEALPAWGEAFRRCEFTTVDALEFIGNCTDIAINGLYVDAPWPDVGDGYRHKFTEQQQQELAESLMRFQHTRIVVRFNDHPLIEKLYPRDFWIWTKTESRNQANAVKPEVYLTRNA
jgi:DNA adenine methylase